MLYPLKFKPVYKDYIWGGRKLELLGKKLPEGKVAESWEISCHPDGISTVSNGAYKGITLPELVKRFKRDIIGNSLPEENIEKFPLLIKFIDASNKLSVQVHPDEDYVHTHKSDLYGKNEMWYIISADPGAKLVYGLKQNISKEDFKKAINKSNVENCLNYITVKSGDFVNIPVGLVHAVGSGILLAEIQQNSNSTFRVYDYERTDDKGNKRPLHIKEALEVIDFNNSQSYLNKGLKTAVSEKINKTYLVANKYFSVEKLDINGCLENYAGGDRFYIYIVISGAGQIVYNRDKIEIKLGDSLLIPASMGEYFLKGQMEILKAYVPDLWTDIMKPLINYGYSKDEIFKILTV